MWSKWKKKLYYSKHFIYEGVSSIAKEEQCLKLQDYIIQKTIMVLSSVCYLQWLGQQWFQRILFLYAWNMLLEEINPSTAYSFRKTSVLSSRTGDIGTKGVNTHMKFCSRSRWIQLYLSATDRHKSILLKQTDPDNQKYTLDSLLSENFIKRKDH